MLKLTRARDAWGTPEFEEVLKVEIQQLDVGELPLQQYVTVGSYATDDTPGVMVINTRDRGEFVQATVGIFYTSVIAGCNCADDPTPVERLNEYCELQFNIDKLTGEAKVTAASQ